MKPSAIPAILLFMLCACTARTATDNGGAKPVKVYILSGQSNMVGMGDVSGGGIRWGKEFTDVVVSVYEGAYDPKVNYDEAEAKETKKLESFGGVHPTPYPDGGVQVARGFLTPASDGVYEFRPGYGESQNCLMEVDGREAHKKEPGKTAAKKLIKLKGGEKVPFKITYLTSKANGLGWWLRTDIPGTLQTVVHADGKFPHLIDKDGNWTVRDDVLYKGVVSDTWHGPLTVRDASIGPELGFGHILGDHHEEPILLIKASIGNRSLGWDILPPGSKRYTLNGKVYAGYKDSPAIWDEGTKPEPINWYAGKTYDRFTESIHDVLKNFDSLYPEFKDRGYEIAGFAWWQGHKDGGSEGHIQNYEKNLISLIKAWRKEFDAKDAPWVIATVGFDGKKMTENYIRILEAQLAVNDPEKHPTLAKTVKTVDIRELWREADESPKAQGYHYNRNAETYYLVGEYLGQAMVDLKTSQ
jgi:alpha-galactosidase